MTGDIPISTTAQPDSQQQSEAAPEQQQANNGLMGNIGGFFSGAVDNVKKGAKKLGDFSPWLLLGGMAVMSMMGAPTWAVVAMGIVGFMMVMGRNDPDPAPTETISNDIPIDTKAKDPKEIAKAKQKEIGGDIPIDQSTIPSAPVTAKNSITIPTLPLTSQIRQDDMSVNSPIITPQTTQKASSLLIR